jgi:hypothetical protein
MVWLGGRRVKLAEGKKNKKAAHDRYDALRFEAVHNPHPDGDQHSEWESDWTKNGAIRNVQVAFNWGLKCRIIRENPFRGVTHPVGQPRRNMTPEEFQAILRASGSEWRKTKPTPASARF